ncbi:hypothetical protein D3C83_215840 [compost metagenome]
MDQKKNTSALARRILDCRKRLLDELATGDFPIGKRTRKLDDRHRRKFMTGRALRESGSHSPECRAGNCQCA